MRSIRVSPRSLRLVHLLHRVVELLHLFGAFELSFVSLLYVPAANEPAGHEGGYRSSDDDRSAFCIHIMFSYRVDPSDVVGVKLGASLAGNESSDDMSTMLSSFAPFHPIRRRNSGFSISFLVAQAAAKTPTTDPATINPLFIFASLRRALTFL
jgi:hypothetical protein